MENRPNDRRSVLMIVSSMLIFGTIGIFRRYIPLSSAFLAFARGTFGGLFLLAFVKLKGEMSEKPTAMLEKINRNVNSMLSDFLTTFIKISPLRCITIFTMHRQTFPPVHTLSIRF